ncbi:hypothetical protein [Siminovitchia terrae]|uniref:hypothetical protein n=1 Tax=Siminovitchia terrae TaxID=1914933 RepID=UPI0028AEAFF8|nr:hypothetical protein [Siminovitchia terrae]
MDKELSWSNGQEWGSVFCPMLGEEVMTYWKIGSPCYDTYTNPFVTEDGEIYCYRLDQDEGAWHEDAEWLGEYNGIDTCRFG